MKILNRDNAINYCCNNGKIFINLFKRIFCLKDREKIFKIANKMQDILNELNDIKLAEFNKFLYHAQKMDWFFTATSNYEKFFTQLDDIELYDKFVLLVETGHNVKKSLLQLKLL